MSELQNIEADVHALEAKIEAWFEKHFGRLAPDSDAHKAALVAHEELKSIIASAPPSSTAAPAAVVTSSASGTVAPAA